MLGLNSVLRTLKSVFRDTDDLESWLRERNPQNSAELNYWIEQYEQYQHNRGLFKNETMT